jgi:hypothetical protein
MRTKSQSVTMCGRERMCQRSVCAEFLTPMAIRRLGQYGEVTGVWCVVCLGTVRRRWPECLEVTCSGDNLLTLWRVGTMTTTPPIIDRPKKGMSTGLLCAALRCVALGRDPHGKKATPFAVETDSRLRTGDLGRATGRSKDRPTDQQSGVLLRRRQAAGNVNKRTGAMRSGSKG